MPQIESINRRITLSAHPRGLPTPQNFQLETQSVPTPGEGQVLLRTLFLSVDPYMRNLMDPVGPGYAPPVAIGGTMVGGTVSRVTASRHPAFAAGDVATTVSPARGWAIDIYFENVGGEVLDAVLAHLNIGARVPVCGFIAHYNDDTPGGPDRRADLLATVLQKRIRMQGFIILDHYGPRFDAFRHQMEQWLADGQVKPREDRVEGLERAPEALIGLLQGRNFGKVVVKVGQD